jgi:DNA-directed RNA polymerase specialized sigma24 family protein
VSSSAQAQNAATRVTSAADPRRFATTRWSLVLAAADPSSPDARAALATLCETYWRPVYDFIRCTGRSADDARDLTQSFFARVLERGDLGHARRERGKFRSFLLTAVRHFLGNHVEYAHAKKRGGAFVHVPFELPSGDDPAPILELASGDTPESIFEHQWAITTLDTAMSRVRADYHAAGRAAVFEELRPFLTTDPDAEYPSAAAALGLTESGVRTAVHRLRRHFGQALRATLAETVDTPVDIDGELSYLLDILHRPRPSRSAKQS